MSQPLVSVGSLIKAGWNNARTHMKATMKIVAWLWAIMSVYEIVLFALFPSQINANGAMMEGVGDAASFTLWSFVLLIIMIVPVLYFTIRLIRMALRLDLGQTNGAEEMKADASSSWKLVLPAILVGLLSGLAALGGTILLIIPGIWIGVSLSLSTYFLLEDNLRGVAALKMSWNTIKGRWWAAFGRMLGVGLVFGIGFSIVSAIVTAILNAIHIPVVATVVVTYALTYFFYVPIQMFAMVKLFHSLKQTKDAVVIPTTPPPAV